MRADNNHDRLANEHKNSILQIIKKKQTRYARYHLLKTATEKTLQTLMDAALRFSWTQRLLEQVEKKGAGALLKLPASRFIAGDTIEEALENKAVQKIVKQFKAEVTFAYEVESAFDPEIAQKNLEEFKRCATTLEGQNSEAMSVKLSALALFAKDPEKHGYSEPRVDEVKHLLRQLLNRASVNDVPICVDMEYFIYKDPTFRIFTELLDATPQYAELLQLAFQCYLKDSPQDAYELVSWAQRFHQRTNERVKIRVVKGANIATDQRHARLGLHQAIINQTWHGRRRRALDFTINPWDPANSPIAPSKEATQQHFLEIMKFLEQHTDCLDVAYGTMNPDSVAHIIYTWRTHQQDLDQRQIQTLFGMHDSLKYALADLVGQQIYVPYAPLNKILAYMARRFVELRDSQRGAMPVMEYRNGQLVQIN